MSYEHSVWHTNPPTPVPILQREDEFNRLLFLYCDRSPRTVVELGTYYGGTLYHWIANAIPGTTIVSVDSYETGVDNRAQFQAWADAAQVKLACVAGYSAEPTTIAAVQSYLWDDRYQAARPIEWLFIDAGHFIHQVIGDWEAYLPLMAADGIVVFHDIIGHPDHPENQVHRLWNILKGQYQHEEFIQDRGQADCGIGVLYVGRPA